MITLKEIKEKQDELHTLISKYEHTLIRPKLFVPEININLNPGEKYAGVILNEDGSVNRHVILLPGQAELINWPDAKNWAKKQGGELPTRREQSLLFANLKEQFEEAYYWSGEQHASASDCAWSQLFSNGYQYDYNTICKLRARAVRYIEVAK